MMFDGRLYASRSLARRADESDQRLVPGVVRYDVRTLGRLPAAGITHRWRVIWAKAFSSHGPVDELLGNTARTTALVRRDFPRSASASPDGGDHYWISWLDNEVESFSGMAMTDGHWLVCGWSSPPRDDLQSLVYDVAGDDLADGSWVDSTSALGHGRENAVRMATP